MRQAGLVDVADKIDEKVDEAHASGWPFLLQDVETAYREAGFYSSRKERWVLWKINQFSEDARFSHDGKTYWQCDGSNHCMKKFEEAYYEKASRMDVQVENQWSFRVPENGKVTSANSHERTATGRFYLGERVTTDGTPQNKDKGFEDPRFPPFPFFFPFRRSRFAQTAEERRKSRPWAKPMEDGDELMEKLIASLSDLLANPFLRRLPKPLLIDGIPAERAFKLGLVLGDYHVGLRSFENVAKLFKELYPHEAQPSCPADLTRALSVIRDLELERLGEVRRKVKHEIASKKMYAHLDNDALVDPIMSVFDVMSKGQWKPQGVSISSQNVSCRVAVQKMAEFKALPKKQGASQ
jgi:hypothetical protein